MTSARLPAITLLLALLFAIAACSSSDTEDKASQPDDESATADEAVTHSYTVRGRVEMLPSEDQDRIQIFHEEVPDFVNQQGETANMAAMSMPFGVADDVSLEGIEEGDPIQFTFTVDWDDPAVSRVTAIEKLPEDTELDLD